MTKTITVELSDIQEKSMEYVTSSSQDWATNSVINRARQASDEIVKIYTNRALDEGINIPVTRDEIVVDAFAREWVKTAEQVAKEFDEELAKK